ncbi:MAG: DUF4375 domain-containing protein [Planctomyces sp.]|jgi:hypothetical protein
MDKNTFLIDLSESERTDFGRVDFGCQNVAQKTFSAIWELESQVNNGGFDQYFRNSNSDMIAYAPESLEQIGARACAEIVRAAIATIAPLPTENDARIEALDAALEVDEELLEELDSKFFSYPDNLTELLFVFVAKNADEFGEVPS